MTAAPDAVELRWRRAGAVLIGVAGVVLAATISIDPLSGDEFLTGFSMRLSFGGMLDGAGGGRAPAGLLRAAVGLDPRLRRLGDGVAAAVDAGAARDCWPALGRSGRACGRRDWAFVACVIVVLHLQIVEMAHTARYHTLGAMFGVWGIAALHGLRAAATRRGRLGCGVGFAAAWALALTTHATLLFPFVGLVGWLVIDAILPKKQAVAGAADAPAPEHPRLPTRLLIVWSFVALALALPVLAWVRSRAAPDYSVWLTGVNVLDLFLLPMRLAWPQRQLPEVAALWLFLSAAAAATALYGGWRLGRERGGPIVAVWLGAWLVGAAVAIAQDKNLLVAERYFALPLIAQAMLLAAAIEPTPPRIPRVLLTIYLIPLVPLSLVGVADNLFTGGKFPLGDAAAFVRQTDPVADVIVLGDADKHLFGYRYHDPRPDRVIELRTDVEADLAALARAKAVLADDRPDLIVVADDAKQEPPLWLVDRRLAERVWSHQRVSVWKVEAPFQNPKLGS